MPKKPVDAPDDTDTAQSYEQARDELAQVVTKLEAGGATLEESLKLWERGERLAAICQEWLDGARQRLEAIAATPESALGQQRHVNLEAASTE
ncbi:MAG: exodeoxyribonuclease VII small subunit [Mycobacteriales bacterium]